MTAPSPTLEAADALPPMPPPAAGAAARVAAALAGLLVLALVAVPTLGMALAGPVGMAVAAAVVRRRRRPLTRGASWLAAAGAATLAIAAAFAYGASRMSPQTRAEIWHAADSAAAVSRQQPAPAWLDKMAPGASRSQSARIGAEVGGSRAMLVWGMVMGGVMTSALFGAFAGTLGWCGGVLLAFALRGRWLPGGGRAAPSTA